ncbi:cyanate transporter [Mesorhizobium sp. CA6]|uniref:cyanate transporter n=1 Tax=Mesorhizobium sp. CA6 TaxID=588500 RepID=UPI001CCFCEAA|nr:cyanate transporter [Mesorhizobium sp. CA6]MBZ9769435.1 cyanate transporter [Mesorhizobium sp. CA6]
MPRITLVTGQWKQLVLVVLIGANLRPFLTAPGPILTDIVTDTGMGYPSLAMLTLLPMLLMGIGAFVAPGIQAVVGTRRGILAALAVLTAGSLLRSVAFGSAWLVLTAALCGAGVAFIQAAFPGIIKEKFPKTIPIVTGLYSCMIMGGGALGARLTPVLVNSGYSWRLALASMAVPAVFALCAAYWAASDTKAVKPDSSLTRRLLRRPRTWALMAAFGLVNAGYSSMVAWLAPYYQAAGLSNSQSGNLVAVMAIAQAASALVLPTLARRNVDRRPWLWTTLVLQAAGFLGLAVVPLAFPALWVGICGAGLGGSFALAIVTALDHLDRPEQAGALVALMQGGGFLIAATGPFAAALLGNWSGSFASAWVMHLACVTITFFIYARFRPERYGEVFRPLLA